MAQAEESAELTRSSRRLWPRRKRWRAVLVFVLILAGGVALGWFTRERIASNVIEGQLRQYDLPANYEIESIGPEQQVLRNLVIGDPDKPDLTIERVEVSLRYRLGTPAIGMVRLTRPRLFGSYRNGALSFGSLDRVIYAESDEPPGLPELNLVLDDGRALIETDFGPIGVKAEGAGQLNDGFRGVLAATAPALAGDGCTSERATFYGDVTTSKGIPGFKGPLRLRGVNCEQGRLELASLDAEMKFQAKADFSGFSGDTKLAANSLALAGLRSKSISGNVDFSWREALLNSRYRIEAAQIDTPQLGLARLSADGSLRARDGFERLQIETQLRGEDISGIDAVSGTLAEYEQTAAGTLAAPLLAELRKGLTQQLPGADLQANLSLRRNGSVLSGVVPSAAIRSAKGTSLLALSQLEYGSADDGTPQLSGNILTGGDNLPRIRGRMEQGAQGQIGLRLQMDEYRAGENSLEIPQMVIAQDPMGALGFSGEVLASGDLPGGQVEQLVLPVSGNYSARTGLSLWRKCVNPEFKTLSLASLDLDRSDLTVCPPRGRAIVRYGARGLSIAAGTSGLTAQGKLADSPIRLTSGAIGFAWPGLVVAHDIDVALGPDETGSKFSVGEIQGEVDEGATGRFDNADISLEAVPLDLKDTNGIWAYRDGTLALSEGAFRLLDREKEARFEPLNARGAKLTLADNIIRANTSLRSPGSDRVVTAVDIRHDLSSGVGHADIDVAGLKFDEALQPEDLTYLALGVVALADGTVTGKGRIDWDENDITSSGEFSTDSFDFAAAFGPVEGASGTIHFTDLLNLTTAPDQVIHVAGINPGIVVHDGVVRYELREGQFLSVKGGEWPFVGGKLYLRPVELDLGASEIRRYVIEIVGADAGQFLATMDMGNLNATGSFDGTVPLVFDEDGNGSIVGGLLISRAPGGNLSYVGDLTYEDLGMIGNYAFSALRSLDFTQMVIEMEGPLTGEIITRLLFDGVRQGEGTSQNFITRQIAKLPIRFKVNITAPFYELLTSVRSTYDPAFVRDPRELGLLSSDGERLVMPDRPETGSNDATNDESGVQPKESEDNP